MSDDGLKAALTEAVMVEMHRACTFLDDRNPDRTRHGVEAHEARAGEYVKALLPVVSAELARQRQQAINDFFRPGPSQAEPLPGEELDY